MRWERLRYLAEYDEVRGGEPKQDKELHDE